MLSEIVHFVIPASAYDATFSTLIFTISEQSMKYSSTAMATELYVRSSWWGSYVLRACRLHLTKSRAGCWLLNLSVKFRVI